MLIAVLGAAQIMVSGIGCADLFDTINLESAPSDVRAMLEDAYLQQQRCREYHKHRAPLVDYRRSDEREYFRAELPGGDIYWFPGERVGR